MIRKRNDDNGHKRGEGPYSSSKLNLDERDFFLRPSNALLMRGKDADGISKSAEATIFENGDRTSGYAAKLDKK